jgi:hypothetical protein
MSGCCLNSLILSKEDYLKKICLSEKISFCVSLNTLGFISELINKRRGKETQLSKDSWGYGLLIKASYSVALEGYT